MPPGARLLEVNGVSVEKFTHNQLNRKVGLPAETPYMSSPSRPEGQYVSPPVLFPIVCMRLALIRGGGSSGRRGWGDTRLSVPHRCPMHTFLLCPHSFGRVEIG